AWRFFFFQAEDGIRDKLVTGVQTCALPISLQLDLSAGDDFDPLLEALEDRDLVPAPRPARHEGLLHDQRVGRQLRPLAGLLRLRSEERRVGNEGGAPWAPDAAGRTDV